MLLSAGREPRVLAPDDMDPLTMTGQVLFILYSTQGLLGKHYIYVSLRWGHACS